MLNRASVRIAAAPDNGRICGVVRVYGANGMYRVEGICAEVSADADFGNVVVASGLDDLFFYGTKKDLRPNFRRPEQSERLASTLFPHHTDQKYTTGFGKRKTEIEIARIPIEELGLTQEQVALAVSLMELTPGFLQKTSSRERREIRKKQIHSYNSVITYFRDFPQGLFDLAAKAGYYFNVKRNLDTASGFAGARSQIG